MVEHDERGTEGAYNIVEVIIELIGVPNMIRLAQFFQKRVPEFVDAVEVGAFYED